MTIAAVHEVFGACSVWWGLAANSVVEIGYTHDGVRMSIDPRWGDIQSDDFGGADGPPADSQFLGGTATLTVELTKYVEANTEALSTFNAGSVTLGTFGSDTGTLVRGSSASGVLVLTTGTDGQSLVSGDLTFPVTFLRGGQEVNRGTKFSTFNASWEAWVGITAGSPNKVLYTVTQP